MSEQPQPFALCATCDHRVTQHNAGGCTAKGCNCKLTPCERCGEHVDVSILRTSPDCPHGWELAPATLADAKALAAELGCEAVFDGT